MAATRKKAGKTKDARTTTVILPADVVEKAKRVSGKKNAKRLILGLLNEEIELQARIRKYKS